MQVVIATSSLQKVETATSGLHALWWLPLLIHQQQQQEQQHQQKQQQQQQQQLQQLQHRTASTARMAAAGLHKAVPAVLVQSTEQQSAAPMIEYSCTAFSSSYGAAAQHDDVQPGPDLLLHRPAGWAGCEIHRCCGHGWPDRCRPSLLSLPSMG